MTPDEILGHYRRALEELRDLRARVDRKRRHLAGLFGVATGGERLRGRLARWAIYESGAKLAGIRAHLAELDEAAGRVAEHAHVTDAELEALDTLSGSARAEGDDLAAVLDPEAEEAFLTPGGAPA